MKRLLFLVWLLLSAACYFSGLFFESDARAAALTAWPSLDTPVKTTVPASLMIIKGQSTDSLFAMEVDQTTGAIPVEVVGGSTSNPAAGPTGSAVPADADFQGLNNGGTLIGAIGDSSGRAIIAGAGTAGTPAGGVLSVQGVASGTALPVSGTFWQTTQPVSGTVTANAGTGTFTVSGTVTNGAGSAIIGKVGIDQTTPGTTNAVSATNFPTTVDTNTGLAGASTPRVIEAGRQITGTILANNPYASTNVTTGAYVQLIASTASAVTRIFLANTSGSIIKLATGAAASEVDRLYIPPGGAAVYDVNIAASTRISLEALDATASTGYFVFTGLP